MRISKPFAILALAMLTGLSATGSFAASKKLNSAEITKAISGKTFTYTGSSSGKLTYTSTRFKGKDTKHGGFSGTWEAKGNKYCFKNSFGSSRCVSVKGKGDGVLKFDRKTFVPQ